MINARYAHGRLDLYGSYIHFDGEGYLDIEQSGYAEVDIDDAVDRIARAKRMRVLDLTMVRKAKALGAPLASDGRRP